KFGFQSCEQLFVSGRPLIFFSFLFLFIHRCYHLRPVMNLIITPAESVSLIKIQQFLPVLFLHIVSRWIIFIQIQIFPVNGRHPCRILRPFHPSFNLQGVNPCIQNLWKDINSTHIFWTSEICVFSVAPCVSFFSCRVSKLAVLWASAAVSAFSARSTADSVLMTR